MVHTYTHGAILSVLLFLIIPLFSNNNNNNNNNNNVFILLGVCFFVVVFLNLIEKILNVCNWPLKWYFSRFFPFPHLAAEP